MKHLAAYLAVTFGLTWGLLVPASLVLGAFQNGENPSALMASLTALGMFFPLTGALAANAACAPAERINLGWRPRIRQNVRYYLVAWFLPAGITLLGCAVFFAANPQWLGPTMNAFMESTAAAAEIAAEQLAEQVPLAPVAMAATIVSAFSSPRSST